MSKQIVGGRQVSRTGQSCNTKWFALLRIKKAKLSKRFSSNLPPLRSNKTKRSFKTLFCLQNRTQNEIRFAGQPKIICLYNIETYYPRARAYTWAGLSGTTSLVWAQGNPTQVSQLRSLNTTTHFSLHLTFWGFLVSDQSCRNIVWGTTGEVGNWSFPRKSLTIYPVKC